MSILNRKGSTLVELLIATALLAVCVPLLGNYFFQYSHFAGRIRENLELRRPWLRASASIERDLSNAVVYSARPFDGNNHAISFVTMDESQEGGRIPDLVAVELGVEDQKLIRKAGRARDGWKISEIVLAENVEQFTIEYAYWDGNGDVALLPFWHQETGLPRGMRITMILSSRSDAPETLTLFLPQGKMGVLNP